jgi:hypothetical protein
MISGGLAKTLNQACMNADWDGFWVHPGSDADWDGF